MLIVVVILRLRKWYEEPPFVKPKVQGRFQKYLIPKGFWDDVNTLEIYIWEMGYDELDRVSFLIDQFCDKYGEISDHQIFRTRVANMLTRYQERKKWILKNKKFYYN